MTNVRIATGDTKIRGFEISGHSGYADYGEDIVCAAVSAISQTAILGITDVLHAQAKVQRDDEQGWLKLTLVGEGTDCTEAVLRTMVAGLDNLQHQYPEFVRITFLKTEVTSK